jgi:hypothetical protein
MASLVFDLLFQNLRHRTARSGISGRNRRRRARYQRTPRITTTEPNQGSTVRDFPRYHQQENLLLTP